ncbi:predicted protein [Streptomyces sp. SPB78]|nr:predicted protein [Streptomyces sp. SPB78]
MFHVEHHQSNGGRMFHVKHEQARRKRMFHVKHPLPDAPGRQSFCAPFGSACSFMVFALFDLNA